jgi:hypothetical protein
MRVPAERRDKVLLKTADDKSKRLALLEDLQRSPLLDARQKKWLREELMRLRKGIQGEKDSAYFLDQYFKGGENHVVLHDLRFVVDGDVAQIDHLVINRGIGMYLLETKNYAGSLSINEQGEFTVQYDECRFGIPSPIEQSHRHERILRRLLEKLEIGNRTGELDVYHVVMVHPKAVIQRPPQKSFDTSHVIKADQFPSWHKQFVDKEFGVTKAIKLAANLRSLDTIKEWGEKLKRQHRPANLLELPSFMQPKEAPPAVQPRDIAPARSVTPMASPPAAASEPLAKRLICGQCGAKISYPEGKFCWNNSARFGGNQYCRTHQALFPA